MRLTLVDVFTCNFTQSEMTNVDAVMREAKLKLEKNQAVMIFSMKGDQAYIVRKPTDVQLIAGGKQWKCYVSAKIRVSGGSWWQNLPEFFRQCEAAGLDVAGFRKAVYDHAEKMGMHIERVLKAVG
jgi:hypothetical protein